MQEAENKASCWCCERCVKSRRRKLCQQGGRIPSQEDGDGQDVFLPSASGLTPEKTHRTNYADAPDVDTNCFEMPRELRSTADDFSIHDSLKFDTNHDSGFVAGDNESLSGPSKGFCEESPFEHLYQVLKYHPKYITIFRDMHDYLIRSVGPLPVDQRCYIAIMAAARHHCSYLVKSLATYFLAAGGDERWLEGLEYVPQKIRNLCEVNRILAHRPWLLSKLHIKNMNRGHDLWSVSEISYVCILMAHFHSLASFVFSCGIMMEEDRKGSHESSGSKSEQPRGSFDDGSSDSDTEIDRILERMKVLRTDVGSCEMSNEEFRKSFYKLEDEAAQLTTKTKKKQIQNLDILRFVEDPEFAFIDFANRSPDLGITPCDYREISWESFGAVFMDHLGCDVTDFLDQRFAAAQSLTYYKMGHKRNVDTLAFRQAVWNYAHCLLGLFHDDYDYEVINHLLERNLRWYVKAATCTPETITQRNYGSFMREFLDSEKVHISIMVLEARLQAGVLYSLQAISRSLV